MARVKYWVLTRDLNDGSLELASWAFCPVSEDCNSLEGRYGIGNLLRYDERVIFWALKIRLAILNLIHPSRGSHGRS